jgi:hypothetical protein
MNILRYTKTIDWTAMWEMYTKSVIATMYKNMAADIDCGYNPFGTSIRQQRENIAAYEKEYYDTLEKFKTMSEQEINHWCFYDLKQRGVIE